jgi:hypothetical protein
VPYVVFPLDLRWLYYETGSKLLNRPRPDLYENLDANEFLVMVPEPRKESETRPMILTTAFDLHLHDRGSVAFPADVVQPVADRGTLFGGSSTKGERRANLSDALWAMLREAWGLRGDLYGKDALLLARELSRSCLAVCHAPSYQIEHKESLAQDWAHVPLPRSRQLFTELVQAGKSLAILLDPAATAVNVLKGILGAESKYLAVPTKTGGGDVGRSGLFVEYPFFGGAKGGWRPRSCSRDEPMCEQWGTTTGDLYINDSVFFRHVPERVRRYELGGYPVIKKWLGYRDRGRRPGVALSVQEADHLRSMVQRISAVLRLYPQLDALYERACHDCFTAEELNLNDAS